MLLYLFFFMYVSGLVSFSLKRKYLLLMLLSLEFILLSLFIMLVYSLNIFYNEIYFSMIFLSVGVCEGALGLAVLVSMVRTYGGDNFQSYSVLW